MTILIIEDEAPIRIALTRDLEDAGYAVESVDNAHEGLEKAGSGKFDLLITDMMIGPSHGQNILADLAVSNPYIPVIVMSGNYPDGDEDYFRLKTGKQVAAVLSKPFEFSRLREEVKKCIGK